ncbi:MAG: protein-export chaperone SecB [Bacteroidetes bacterium]|nr:protein-export chaperone SecB [Bacteroidota bacterium]
MNDKKIQGTLRLKNFKAPLVEMKISKQNEIEFQPNFSLTIQNLRFLNSVNAFGINFKINLISQNSQSEEWVSIKVEYHAIFECDSEITDEFLESSFVRISAPAIGFPYVRSFISNITLQAGIPPVILPSINFVQFNQEAIETATEE